MRSFVCSLALLACSLTTVFADAAPAWRGAWFPATIPVKAVALVIHGLNLKPEKMDALSQSLADSGVEVLRLALSGHGFGRFDEVTSQSWLQQSRAGYLAAAKKAQNLGVPLFFLGYSLGGLLGEVLLTGGIASTTAHFDRVVLLAPAIAVRPVTSLVKMLFPLGKGFTVPSADSPDYRAHAGTPMAAYEALFQLVAVLRRSGYRGANVPTLLFVRKDDELVSLHGIEKTVRDRFLTKWSVILVPNNASRSFPRHLIIDSESLGRAEWLTMRTKILSFLLDPDR